MFEIAELRQMDSVLRRNDYSDETLERMLPFVNAYVENAAALRALPLAETKSVLVMLAGARR